MTLQPLEAIPILEDCLERLADMAKRTAEAASPPDSPDIPGRLRVDLYALLTIGAVYELSEGTLAETRAKRPINASRLARHLFEFDVETSWVLRHPEIRVERRVAEDIRQWLKLVPDDDVPASVNLEAAREFVAEVRARIPAAELGNHGDLIPSRRQMARELSPVEDYDLAYGRLSHVSHPGLLAGGRFIRRIDAQGREIWRPPRDGSEEAATLLQAGHSAGRCVGRLAPHLGIRPGADLAEILTTIRLIGESPGPSSPAAGD